MNKKIITTVFAMGLILIGVGSMAAQSSSVAGSWTLQLESGPGKTFTLEVDGDKLTGRLANDRPIVGRVRGVDIYFRYSIAAVTYAFAGTVKGNLMSGIMARLDEAGVEIDSGKENWTAKRD